MSDVTNNDHCFVISVKRRKKLHEKTPKEERNTERGSGGGSAPTEDDEVGSSVSASTKTSAGNAGAKGRSAFNAAKKTVIHTRKFCSDQLS